RGRFSAIPHTGKRVSSLHLRQGIKPFARRGVVMGAGVDDRVMNVVAGKIRIIGVAIECKLKDPGPGDSELIAQSIDIRGDESEVFGDEWKLAQFPLCSLEELGTGAGYPLTRLRRWRAGGDM